MPEEINIEIVPPVDEPEEIEEPEWQPVLLAQQETNRLLFEVIAEMRNQSQASSTLVPSLLETNSRLTSQLQETPRMVVELLTPLISPPPIVVAEISPPPSDDSLTDAPASAEPMEPEVIEVAEVIPPEPPAKQRPKFRRL